MSRYNLRVSRELSEEEVLELEQHFSDSDDNIVDVNESDSSDNDSEFDVPGTGDNVMQDVRLAEMQHYIEMDVDVEHSDEEVPPQEEIVEAVEPNRGAKYTGQGKGDKTVWWSMPSEHEKRRTENAKRKREQAFAYSTQIFHEKKDAFIALLSPAIVELIALETNRKAKKVYSDNEHAQQRKRLRPWKNIDAKELYAYIGILLYAGAEKSNLVHAKDLFHKSHMPFYRAVMSLERFEQITRFLRFDDSRTRLIRLQTDKLAPIRHTWGQFQKNLTLFFKPSLELCIDEQLLNTRNRCSFRQYIPSKPGKYGIKIFWLVDSRTNYPLSAEIYLGTQPNENRSKGIAHELVLRLSKDYLNMGANITMDNFFTSYGLAQELVEKETTIVGTIRLNKRELPAVFAKVQEARKRGPNNSVFCFSKSCELVSYTTDTLKNVVLLSTAHATEEVNPETHKPLIIHDYNRNKGGVDTLDKMLRCYSSKRKSNRWPMVIFHNIIDVAAFAAYRIFELNHPLWNVNKQEKRKLFLKELAFDLAKDHLDHRCKTPLKKSVKTAMELIGLKAENITVRHSMPEIQVNNKRRRCEFCKDSRTKDNKTSGVCDHCLKPACPMHYVRSCENCYLRRYKDPSLDDSEEEEDSGPDDVEEDPSMPSTSTGQPSKRRRESILNL